MDSSKIQYFVNNVIAKETMKISINYVKKHVNVKGKLSIFSLKIKWNVDKSVINTRFDIYNFVYKLKINAQEKSRKIFSKIRIAQHVPQIKN